jgi:predicted MFS family arabinose efflux permease
MLNHILFRVSLVGSAGLLIEVLALAFAVASMIYMTWSKTPETRWLNNWIIARLIVLTIAVSLIQMFTLNLAKKHAPA